VLDTEINDIMFYKDRKI